MNHTHRLITVAACALALSAGVARAQEQVQVQRTERIQRVEGGTSQYVETERVERVEVHEAWRPRFLIEGSGGYGLQIGNTEYLPQGAVGQYQYPLVHGWAAGATAGVVVDPAVALIANYEYSNSRSWTGDLEGILNESQGFIDYHTVVAGVRVMARLPFGALQAELAGGVVLPFETELRYTYGPALAQLPTPITGTGSRISHYSVGFGGHGLVGYRIPIVGPLYAALNLKLRLFQSENSGETQEYRNFVADFGASPFPMASNTTIQFGDGARQPSTYSVQDARLQLAIGAEI